jgi:hypothetical protein
MRMRDIIDTVAMLGEQRVSGDEYVFTVLRHWLGIRRKMLGESVENYHWVKTPMADFAATFEVGNVTYAAYFDASGENPTIFNFGFAANANPQTRWQTDVVDRPDLTPEDFQKRGIKVPAALVYATVNRIVDDFISHHKPDMVRFTGATERQTKLYQKLTARRLMAGYHVVNINRHILIVKDGFSMPSRFQELS